MSEHEKSQQCSLLFADEIAEFLTKTELKKCKNSPKVSLDGYHLSAFDVSQKNVETMPTEGGKCFEESL